MEAVRSAEPHVQFLSKLLVLPPPALLRPCMLGHVGLSTEPFYLFSPRGCFLKGVLRVEKKFLSLQQ